MRHIFFGLLVSFCSVTALGQSNNYDVYALRFGSIFNMPLSFFVDNAKNSKDSVAMCSMFWLIKGNNKNILVDAGYLRDLADSNLAEFVRPDSMLLPLGVQAKDITDIILSHPHFDHIDGIDLFPNATVWMQKKDFDYFVTTAWQKGGRNMGFDKRDVQKLVDVSLAGRLALVDGDNKEIFPGIHVYTGSRHTFNSQFALISTNKGKIILASDNIWIYYNLEHLASVPDYGTFDKSAYVQSMKRMQLMVPNNKYIIPGHDARIFSVFPTVKKGIVKLL